MQTAESCKAAVWSMSRCSSEANGIRSEWDSRGSKDIEQIPYKVFSAVQFHV